jgi:carbonic anhydrase
MQHLVRGVHEFQNEYFQENQELFQALAHGQQPDTLLITCSDSRIQPGILMNAQPGELFIIRNAGNLVPPDGASNGGEAATIEYAVKVLKVAHIIVMGHSHCGALKALLQPESLAALPRVADWLKHAAAVRETLLTQYADCSEAELLNAAVQENALLQRKQLLTYPAIAKRVTAGKLKLHAWIFHFETGDVLAYDPATRYFASITNSQRTT